MLLLNTSNVFFGLALSFVSGGLDTLSLPVLKAFAGEGLEAIDVSVVHRSQ